MTAYAGPFGAVQFIRGLTQQVNGLTVLAPPGRGAASDVVEHTQQGDHRGRIDGDAAGLVVQRNVAARDGYAQLLATVGQAAHGLGELPHDVGVLGGAEVQAVGDGRRTSTGGRDVSVGLGERELRAGVRVQAGVATVAVGGQGHAQTGFLVHTDHAGVIRHGHGGVALHIVVVLAGDPVLGAQVGRGHQFEHCLAQLRTGGAGGVLGRAGEMVGLQLILGLGASEGSFIDRAVMGHGARIHVHDHFAPVIDDQTTGVRDLTDPRVLHVPFGHDRLESLGLSRGHHGHHAFLGLGHQDLAGGQGGIAQQHLGQVHTHSAVTVGGELGGCAGNTRGTEVLNALHQGALEQLQAALDEHLFRERVSHLDCGALGRLGIVKGFGGQYGGATNTVTARAGTEQHHFIAGAGGVGQADVLVTHDAHRQSVDQRVALVAGIELHFTADVGQTQRVAVATHTGHHTVHHALGVRVVDGTKTQRVHHGHRAGTHGDDVADNATHTGRGTLVGLHEGRVVVGLDLEGHGPAVTDVRDTGVLPDAHHEVLAHLVGDLVTELTQMHLGGLVGAVFGPHDRVHGQFRGGGAAAQDLLDPIELGFGQPQLRPG